MNFLSGPMVLAVLASLVVVSTSGETISVNLDANGNFRASYKLSSSNGLSNLYNDDPKLYVKPKSDVSSTMPQTVVFSKVQQELKRVADFTYENSMISQVELPKCSGIDKMAKFDLIIQEKTFPVLGPSARFSFSRTYTFNDPSKNTTITTCVTNVLAAPDSRKKDYLAKPTTDLANMVLGTSFLNNYGAVIQNNILTLTVPT